MKGRRFHPKTSYPNGPVPVACPLLGWRSPVAVDGTRLRFIFCVTLPRSQLCLATLRLTSAWSIFVTVKYPHIRRYVSTLAINLSKMQAPVVVMSLSFHRLFAQLLTITLKTDTQAGDRQVGRKAQLSNITAAKTYVLPFGYSFRMFERSNIWTYYTGLRILCDHVSVPKPCSRCF